MTAVEGGSCEYYKNCPADGQVALCLFEQPDAETQQEEIKGHGWSGGLEGHPYAISPTENAAELGFAFFKKYAW